MRVVNRTKNLKWVQVLVACEKRGRAGDGVFLNNDVFSKQILSSSVHSIHML